MQIFYNSMNFGMIFHGMLYLSLYEELFSNLHYWNSNLFQIKSQYWIAIREKLFLSPKIKSSYFMNKRTTLEGEKHTIRIVGWEDTNL